MARIYPEHLPETLTSEAEQHVLNALRRLGPDYVVFCQLAWLTPNVNGRPNEGEADVVIVHPDWGIQVIEVKGGIIDVDPSRGWTSNGIAIRDPVEQARSAAHRLNYYLGSSQKTRGYAYPFGYGVWFPDIDAVAMPPRLDAPDDIILDAASLEEPQRAVEGLYGFWLRSSAPASPGLAGVQALTDLLSPTWILRPMLGPAIIREQAEQQRLTEQQFSLLSMLGRRPRALIAGCAGSGKTVLAMEKARRLALDGFQVLFTCFNKNLAAAVRTSLEGTGVAVSHFHELCYRIGLEAGVELPLEGTSGVDDKYFNEKLPEALASATATLGARYDAIVVDEGQDFLDLWWVALVDLLRDPSSGVLYVFFDNRQDIYRRTRAWPIADEPFELTTNCRSAQAIHRLLRRTVPGGLDHVDCIGPEGRLVEVHQVSKERPERDVLRRVLHRLIHEEHVANVDMVVLTPRRQSRSLWEESQSLGNARLTWSAAPVAGRVQVSTIHGFKGLDRPMTILTELAHLPPGLEQELLYVARSRATSHLVELVPEGFDGAY